MKLNIKALFKKDLIPFYVILVAGSYLRLQTLLTNSFAFTYDVGRDLIAISQIASLEKISLIGPTTGLQGVFYGPWWYLLLAPFFILSQGNPAGIEFVMFLAGAATIILSFIVGNKISGKFMGSCFAAVVAFSQYLIFTSSQIWSPNLAPLFTILIALCLFYIFFQKRKGLAPFLYLGLLLGFVFELEIIYGSLLFAGVCASVIIHRKLCFKLKEIILFAAGVVIIFSPKIIFELRHGFLMTKSLIAFLVGGSTGLRIDDFLSKRIDFMLNEFSNSVSGNSQSFGLLIIVITLVILFFARKYIRKEERAYLITTFIIILTFFLGILFFRHDLYPHYFAGLAIFFILPVAIALRLVAEKFNYYFSIFLLLIIILINFNPITFVKNLQNKPFVGNAAVYRNQLAVVDYVYSHANGRDFKYVVYTPPVYDYTYRYLFDWYGVKKYGYKARQQPELAYFILEPDYESPQRLKDWLNIRHSDGKIIRSEKLPSGIVIQTRVNK